eukprot:Skav225940  [mRNA]  locus=scaffold1500:454301:456821:- [translate_table: standard]
MSPQFDSNFGFGVYSARKAPHQWRSKKEIFINNFFPSKKDWQQRKHLDFTEWPSLEALKFNKLELIDHELDELLNTPFGQAVLKKWESTRKCDFCIPIVCVLATTSLERKSPAGVMFGPLSSSRKRPCSNKADGSCRCATPASLPGVTDAHRQRAFRADPQDDAAAAKTCSMSLISGGWAGGDAEAAALCWDPQRSSGWMSVKALEYATARVMSPTALQRLIRETTEPCDRFRDTERGRTIFDAAYYGDLPAVRGFLRTDSATVHLCDRIVGGTALHRAALHGRVAVCEVLLAAASDPNTTDHWRREPRCFLGKLPPQLGPALRRGWTPLHEAALYGHAEVVRCLLAAKAKVDVKDWRGDTPLHLAAVKCGSLEVAQLLLAAKAAVDIKNDKGLGPRKMMGLKSLSCDFAIHAA